ncbi:MAG: anti-sigma factor family protein [bacterium]
MSCKKWKKKLSSYLDDEVSYRERLKIEKHLKSCQACFNEFKQLDRIHRLVQTIPHEKLRPGFYERLSHRLSQKGLTLKEKLIGWRYGWQLSFPRVGRIAIAISAVLILSVSFYIWRSSTSYEVDIKIFEEEYLRSQQMNSFAGELVLPVFFEGE